MKLKKEDLMWEATRRKEDYKNDYQEYLKVSGLERITKFKEVFSPRSNHRWKLKGFLDPSISIYDIYEMEKTGEELHRIHPYIHLRYQDAVIENEPLMITHRRYQELFLHHIENHLESHEIEWLKGVVNQTKDRILLSIDPSEPDKVLINRLKAIKKEYRIREKEEKSDKFIESEIDNQSYHPNRIKSYINWLKNYDSVIRAYFEKNQAVKKIEKGAIKIDFENFSYHEMISNDSKKWESERRKWNNDFDEAVKLIQLTPNFQFSQSRTEKM